MFLHAMSTVTICIENTVATISVVRLRWGFVLPKFVVMQITPLQCPRYYKFQMMTKSGNEQDRMKMNEYIMINLASLRSCCTGQYRVVKLSLHHSSKNGGIPLHTVQAPLLVV